VGDNGQNAGMAYPGPIGFGVGGDSLFQIIWHEANRQLSTADLLKDLNAQLEKRYQDLQTKRKERMMFEQRNPEVVESIWGGIPG